MINKNTKNNNVMLMREYIKALTENVNKEQLPKELNLIFDGGVFNCGFAVGIALYIKQLEKENYVKINKISGCSSGALVALWFIRGCKESGIPYFERIMQTFKKEFNFQELKNSAHEFVKKLFLREDSNDHDNNNKEKYNDNKNVDIEYEDISVLNDKLFINYYDTTTNKQIIVSKFDTIEHLTQCLMRSCFIPYIIDGFARCDEHYIDGIVPHIFNDEYCESLFIKLLTLKKCSRAFLLKYENNIHFRLLNGVSDANDFFTTGKSDMCCYVKNRSLYDGLILRGREIIFILIITIIEWIIFIKMYIPESIQKSLMYNRVIQTSKLLLIEIVHRMLV